MFIEYSLSVGHCTLKYSDWVANHQSSKTPSTFILSGDYSQNHDYDLKTECFKPN